MHHFTKKYKIKITFLLQTNVSFIPYFRLLVFGLSHLALQNVNKDYVIFSYFRNFGTKSGQKPRTKNGMNETFLNHFIKKFGRFFYAAVL